MTEVESGPDADRGEGARLVRHGLANATGRLVIGAIGIVLVPIMLSGLGTEAYGLWIAALALGEIAASLDFGLGWAITREVARDPTGGASSRFVSTAGVAIATLGLCGAAMVAASGYLLTGALELGQSMQLLAPAVFVAMGIAFAAEALIGYATAVLYGLRSFGLVTSIHVALAVARAAGIIILLESGHSILSVTIWYATVTWIAAVGIAAALFIARPGFRIRPGQFDRSELFRHAVFSVASQLTSLGTTVLWKTPALLLGVVRGAESIVPLHLGQRLPVLAYSLGWRASEATFPAASQHQATDDLDRARAVLLVGTRWSILATLPLLLVMGAIAPWFLDLWLGEADAEVVAVLRVTAVAVLVHMMGATALHTLWGRGRGVQVCAIVATMATAIVLGTLLLVRDFGAVGAAWSMVPAMLLGSALLISLAGRPFGLTLLGTLRHALQGLLLPSIATIGFAALCTRWFGDRGWLAIVLVCGAGAVIFTAAYLMLGSREEERRLLFRVLLPGRRRGERAPPGRPRAPRFVRSLRDFLANLRYYVYDESHTRPDHFENLFREQSDPWSYGSMPERGADRFATALDALNAAFPAGRRHGSALEIGCAEGLFTELLAPRFDRLIGADVSSVALSRAADRCASLPQVELRTWDMLRDPSLPEQFELVVAMGVLDNYVRIGQLEFLRERLVQMLRPGGYLFLESTRTGGDLEDSLWRRWLHRGKWLNHFMAQHPQLETIDVRTTSLCVQTLCRRRS